MVSRTITGQPSTAAPVVVFQFNFPVRVSKQYTFPSPEPNTTLFPCTAGEEKTAPSVLNDHFFFPSFNDSAITSPFWLPTIARLFVTTGVEMILASEENVHLAFTCLYWVFMA